ncbi:MAG: 3-dehydroquinate synthase [Deltaproteobacteria bacterium]|nr:MAG: 3-dehydroquinate synthase [Deltaproteobacteria bacterium]
MNTYWVKTPTKSYPVYVTGLQDEDSWLKPLKKIVGTSPLLILTSPRVARHCWKTLKKALNVLDISYQIQLIPDGEENKNIKTVATAYSGFVKRKVDRSTKVLILGGGVLGDMGGFVAATYLRGLKFIQVPTTLVGQVDSSVGGKLGIDLPEGKNLVGVFQQPEAVFCHTPFLKTLPRRELRGGLGEVIKYGVIDDPKLFGFVSRNVEKILGADPVCLLEIVKKSVAIKARVVSEDEKESGLRMILNFGHTYGHALERLTDYETYHHGEAVGVGMVWAASFLIRWVYVQNLYFCQCWIW